MFFAAALTISLQLQRATFDILDAVNIEVVAHNPGKLPVSATFPSPAQYELDLLNGSKVVWTSLRPTPPTAHFPSHSRSFMPGPNVLAVYIWNGLTSDGTALAPGRYMFRARMLTNGTQAEATVPVQFINTVPVSVVGKLRAGEEMTISGMLDTGKTHLTDPTGTLTLMRKLSTAPQAAIAVRGYLTQAPDRTPAFFVERWAPLPENTSAPVSIPSPSARRH
ncbi:MAG: hypothetical protein JO322_12435 [Candidatus Eremiobacteraeota bacterium]|nr:hypothetical protein [Candidatus Eremiobacteraeota bacterium]